jgi:invasion protein IalB
MSLYSTLRFPARRHALTPALIVALAAAFPLAADAAEAQKAQPAKPAASPAAQTLPVPKQLGSFDAWTSAEYTQSSAKVCYMFARPAGTEPKGFKRDEHVMLVITHRPAAKRQDEASYQSGYAFKDGSQVAVDIDGKKFDFFTSAKDDPEAAWAPDANVDKAVIAGMKAGKTVKVRGTSARNTVVLDTFSLAGFAKAYAEIGKACGVK